CARAHLHGRARRHRARHLRGIAALAVDTHRAFRTSGDRLPRQPICRLALGSGPARALARAEPLFEMVTYRDTAASAALVIESDAPPPAPVVAKVAQACGLSPEALTILYAPTQSLAGGTQVVARVLEVALHKAHELKFPLDRIVEGMGAAPLPPPHPDFV